MNKPIDIYHDHCMFKANRLEDGKTVYGSLVFDGSAMGGPLGFMPPTYVYHIVQFGSWNGQPVNSDDLVDPDTIGIFTGRLEENGHAVYEPLDDILHRTPSSDNKALTYPECCDCDCFGDDARCQCDASPYHGLLVEDNDFCSHFSQEEGESKNA